MVYVHVIEPVCPAIEKQSFIPGVTTPPVCVRQLASRVVDEMRLRISPPKRSGGDDLRDAADRGHD